MQLVIAEKPSVAKSIAQVIGANERKDGYLEGNGYLVSWCVGHLVELAQYKVLKQLMHEASVDSVVCATDAGREGELIFRLVYDMAECKKPMKRLWISSMEESAIKEGFENLKPGSDYTSFVSAL